MAEVRVETYEKCRLSTLKRTESVGYQRWNAREVSVINAETHGKCRLLILTTITERHQTSVQKKCHNTKVYINRFTSSQQACGQTAKLQGDFFFA